MQHRNEGQEQCELVDESQESVPGTPPSKKFKSMFFSAIASKTTSNEKSNKSVILAKDSDDESD